VKLKKFIVVCGKYIQDTAYQFLSKSIKYCRSYDTNFVCFMTVTNFRQNVPVEKLRKSVNICRRYGQKFVAYFFGPPGIYKNIKTIGL